MSDDESSQQAYERGHQAGEIASRLAGHDQHFSAINGTLEKISLEMHSIALQLQAVRDEAKSNAATSLATTAALKEARDLHREKSEAKWTPISRFLAVVVGLAVFGSFAMSAYLLLTK